MGDPLIRCQILIPESLRLFLQNHYGYGWSAKIRDLIEEHKRQVQKKGKPYKPTLGDMFDD